MTDRFPAQQPPQGTTPCWLPEHGDNIYAFIAAAQRCLRNADRKNDALNLLDHVRSTASYEEALHVIAAYVVRS